MPFNQHMFETMVYIEDTDMGGVVYHANYLKFAERARTEFLRSIGFNQTNLQQQNVYFVVKKCNIDYISPTKMDQEILIRTTFLSVRRLFFECLHVIMDKKTNRKVCEIKAKIATVAMDEKGGFFTIKIPNKISDCFLMYINEDTDAV